jgi:hypothetical protein
LRAALSALSDAAALSRERLSDVACASSERRGAGALSWARLSLLLAAVLLSTSAPKLSFRADGSESDRADLVAAVWKDVFADTSDVTLTTGDPRAELSAPIQQGPGHPLRQEI